MVKTEARIQQEIFAYHHNKYPEERDLLFAIHNNPRNRIAGARLVSQGLVAGVADMEYLRPGKTPLFMEIKTDRGRQSPSQVRWGNKVIEMGAAEYYVIRSLEEAKKVCGWTR